MRIWAEFPRRLCVSAGEVHVWRAELQHGETDQAPFLQLASALSPDEQHRASRYRSEADARNFLWRRAVLRQILSSYLGTPAAELSFTYTAYGKPALANAGAGWLRFNLSHSGDVALYAVARDRDIGVDIERIRPELASWQLAKAFFAEGELRALRELSEEQSGDQLRADAFFNCWTRKEAYLKATGTGLSGAMDDFEVPLACNAELDQPARIVAPKGDWSLKPLDAGQGFAAACAAEGQDWKLKLWRWSPAFATCSQAA